jgi:uncharacterized protein (DUF1501 family)
MKRRELIRRMTLASIAAGVAPTAFPIKALAAVKECTDVSVPDMQRTVVNVMLNGGADLRFLFMPKPGTLSTNHENLIFSARKEMYAFSNSDNNPVPVTYAQMFANEYIVPNILPAPEFGIYKRCGWLVQQYELGRVAIVANAYCSRNRRHDQSILNADAGEPDYTQLNYDRDGWGGRLVEAIGNDTNSIEIGGSITVFNKGTSAGTRLGQVIHAQQTRDIALPNIVAGGNSGRRDVMTRALKGYYNTRGQEILTEKPADWPYHAFFDHNAAFRSFGDSITARLEKCGAIPTSLISPNGGDFNLYQNGFEQQCRNLYDVCLAPDLDLFNPRAISMSYGGWDTHGNQEVRAGNNLNDLFGLDKGLDRTTQEIAALETNAIDQLVFSFASDFGRQIVTNGDLGTDHGKGTYSILIGSGLNGGTYGEMFPEIESVESGGLAPLQIHGADILGQTSTERVLSEVCNWVEPGSAGNVFPFAVDSGIETSGMLTDLFKV